VRGLADKWGQVGVPVSRARGSVDQGAGSVVHVDRVHRGGTEGWREPSAGDSSGGSPAAARLGFSRLCHGAGQGSYAEKI